jgi:glucuronokinase
MIIETSAFSRAGLIGNPSDGYFGRTLSIIVRNFRAKVTLYESPELQIVPGEEELFSFKSIDELVGDVCRHGYYGGVRLMKASIRKFSDYCSGHGIELPHRNFTIEYTSNIPRLVGMGGSSALVTAVMRALMQYYEIEIPKQILPNIILSAEKDELKIGAGLQDRVSQVYEGVVCMDFAKEIIERDGYGRYEELDPALLPPLYLAYDVDRAEGSEQFHNHIRALFDEGDAKIVAAMKQFAGFAGQARDLIVAGRGREIGPLMDANFDLRSSIYQISPENLRMIRTARSAGASAKFAGSGGTIIGVYEDEKMFAKLNEKMNDIGCAVLKPSLSGQ